MENATQLLQENATRCVEYGEQLSFAEKSIERLLIDNRELKKHLGLKESALNENTQKVDLSSKEFSTVLNSKDSQIETLRETIQQKEVFFF